MHNLSNQYFESQYETGNYEYAGETPYELSPELEFGNEFSNEYSGESAYELSPEFAMEGPQFESYELQLAQELMEVSNEAEFFDWIKNTAKKAAGVAVNFIDSPTGQQATAALNNIAQKTLPAAGAAGGGWLGKKGGEYIGGAIAGALTEGAGAPVGKAIGGALGSKAGSWAGGKAGQWAADRFPSFVKMTTDTIRSLAKEVSMGRTPAVKPAIIRAAARHYPIILKVKGTISATPVSRGGGSSYQRENEYNEFNEFNEFSGETSYEGEITHNEGTFNEIAEMELASELLSIQNEAELDRFLGKLFKKAAGAVSNFAKSGAGKALGGILKGVAKKVLPIAGGALGSLIPIPGVGTALGTALGNAAGNLFELELEGLSAEDREFEVARAYVRFAGNAARRASRMRNASPSRAARTATVNAARRYAPGLIGRRNNYFGGNSIYSNNYFDDNGNAASTAGNINALPSGNWYREGNKIVIEGA